MEIHANAKAECERRAKVEGEMVNQGHERGASRPGWHRVSNFKWLKVQAKAKTLVQNPKSKPLIPEP
jgi:hypothetical protein